MNKILKNISVCFLSLLVLMASTSFTIDKHYCGETLVDVSYFGAADNCGMEDIKSSKKKKKCCKNETEVIKLTAFEKDNGFQFSTEEIQFLVFHTYSYIHLFQAVELEKKTYKEHPPPDIAQDIQVLYETFLI